MSTWNNEDLTALGEAEEVAISSYRPDGSLRPFVTIWGARVEDDFYIRSAYGPDNGWFRRARVAGRGSIRAGGVHQDVTYITTADPAVHTALDVEYHRKYDRYGPSIVGSVVGPAAVAVTVRLDPVV